MGIQYAVASAPARAGRVNEDAAVARHANGGFVAAVADGHAGDGVDPVETAAFARFVAERTAETMEGPADRIGAGFDETAAGLRAAGFDPNIGAVVMGIFIPENGPMLVAHAGDVRLYANVRRPRTGFDRRPGFRTFTTDHSAGTTVEDARLRPLFRSGAFVTSESVPYGIGWGPGGTLRLHYVRNGVRSAWSLEPSRGFGDADFQPAYTHLPEVTTVSRDGVPDDAVFALCSDGARRNVGRTFAHFERAGGVPDALEPVADLFLRFHRGEVDGVSSRADDDGTAIFFRPTD